jgi:hypothetical protein
VEVILSAATHGLDLIVAGAPAIVLDPNETYDVWTTGDQLITPDPSSILPTLSLPSLPKSLRSAAHSYPQTFQELPLRVQGALAEIESPEGPASVRVLGHQPLALRGASTLHPFILRDQPGGQYGGAMEIHVQPHRAGLQALPPIQPVPLYVDDEQRLLVRSLVPQKHYHLELAGPKGMALVCVVGARVAGGPVPQISGAAGSVGPDYVITAPGSYTLFGTPLLWCTLPFATRDDRTVKLSLAASP